MKIIRKLKIAIQALMLKAIDRILINDMYCAYHGMDFYFVLWDLDQHWLRSKIKYGDLKKNQYEILQETRDELYRLMNEQGVDLDHVE